MIYTTPSVSKSWSMLVAHDSRKQISYRLLKSTFRVSPRFAREPHSPVGRASLPSLALRFQPRPSVLFDGLSCSLFLQNNRLSEYRRCRYWKIYNFLPRIAVNCLKGSMCCCYFYTAAVRVKIKLLW